MPTGYRERTEARRYLVALAAMVRHHTEAAVKGGQHGYRVIRSELAGQLPARDVETVLDAYRIEGTKLAAAARASVLVERALRGEVFRPEL